MQNLSKFTVQRGDDEYELSLGWDDEAFVKGSIKFDISALKRNIETREEFEPLSATVAVVSNPNLDSDEVPSPFVQIVVKNEITGQVETINYPLNELFEESQVVDLIPAYMFGGDPITGCLIRSGISTTVSQIIGCKNQTAGILPWFWARVSALGECLLISIPDMTAKMVRKSVRCILRFGF